MNLPIIPNSVCRIRENEQQLSQKLLRGALIQQGGTIHFSAGLLNQMQAFSHSWVIDHRPLTHL